MNPNTLVFYAGVLIHDIDKPMWHVPLDTPEGAWAYASGFHSKGISGWFHKRYGWNPVPVEDVPKDIRLMAHLLSQ